MAYVGNESPEDHISGILLAHRSQGSNPLVQGDALSTIGVTTAWIAANITATEGFLVIPVKSLAGLVDTEADESTGDWRYIVRAMVESFYDDYAAMATANKPDNMTISESSLIDTTTAGESNRTWTVTATLNTGALEVADE